MSLLWIDASAGLAGDMLCAALLDAGADEQRLLDDLAGLEVGGWRLRTSTVQRGPFAARRFDVQLDDPSPAILLKPRVHADHGHDHAHDHGHHRHYADVRALLDAASLPPRARSRAQAVFARLAQAEARVHGVPVDEVAFHEVGAVDSIVDIVGAALLLEQLDVERVVCTPLPLGGGHADTAHGRISLPAPATVELLRGWPVTQDGRMGELVTPTGAALAVTLAEPGAMPTMVPDAVGYGAGTWDPVGWANVTRVVRGAAVQATAPLVVEVLEAQVDDMPGEHVPPLFDALFAAGALDACATPVLMKKGRPGLLLTALAPLDLADAVADAMLRHTSTLGLRRHRSSRTVLDRRLIPVSTPYGEVRVKVGFRGEVEYHAAPEYEDCAARAAAAGVPVAEVFAAAVTAYRRDR